VFSPVFEDGFNGCSLPVIWHRGCGASPLSGIRESLSRLYEDWNWLFGSSALLNSVALVKFK
jgi:hypothetical protein